MLNNSLKLIVDHDIKTYQLPLLKPGILDLYISLRSSKRDNPVFLLVLQTRPLIIHLLLKNVFDDILVNLIKCI